MNIIDKVIHTEATRKNVRLMFPVLVHWAKTGQNEHTYGDLAHAIGKSKFTGIGYALYAVQEVLNTLSVESGREDIPTLNSLCKNAKTMLPSEGFEFVSPKYNELDENGKSVFVEGLDSQALNYPHWDWVLDQLGLQPSKIITEQELEAISVHVGGGEGKEHKAIKEFVYKHPESLGLTGVTRKETEHPLPSGDRLDVYFETSDCRYAIEVKPSTSPDDDITRGIFQCVKYKAVMEAIRKIGYDKYAVKTLLVTASGLSERNKKLAEALNVPYTENYKI